MAFLHDCTLESGIAEEYECSFMFYKTIECHKIYLCPTFPVVKSIAINPPEPNRI